MVSVECLPAEQIVRYVDGSLAGDERVDVERHADACATCRMALSELAAGSLAPRSAVDEVEPIEAVDVAPGAAIDRYLVLYRIGRGGMATVYAAYDPELDRKIALKILHGRGHRDHARLLREARTLAQLSHPNVVAVFDVGEHDGLLFLAMELIQGQTLREWVAREPRTWRELAPVFVDVARALAAAHAKGIVHRDVKPENLLIDGNGVVRVGDFGLAARGVASDAVAGTPAYMAPEQFDGDAGPAADQYALCVTIYEALCGSRPGEIFDVKAPRPIADAVRRGLAKRPEDRHASMAALADALAIDPFHKRRQLALGIAAVTAVAGVAFASQSATSGPLCDAPDATRWSERRAAVQRVFVAAKREQAFAAVDAGLAKYFADWGAMSTESCKRTRVSGDQSDAMLDLRTRCLDQRMTAATALIDVLANAKSTSVVEGAVTAVAGLPAIAGCADTETLTAVVPIDPAKRPSVDALNAQLAKAAALQLTGQYPAATAIMTPVLAEAAALDYAPVLGVAKHLEGDLLYRAGDYPASAKALTEAMAHAARGRDDRTATKALTLLAGIVGYAQGKHDEGMALAITADAWSARAGRVPEDEAELADIRGLLHDAKGEPLLAKPFYERALALREQLYGRDHLMVALSLNNLAAVPYTLGKLDEARALHERAKAIRERVLGPVSADLAVTLNALASIDENEDKLDDAERGFRRAIEIWTQVLGPDHPDLGVAYNNLGNLLRMKKDYAGAIAALERARAIWAPLKHPSLPSVLGNLGIIHYEQADYEKALALITEQIAQSKVILGDTHPSIGSDLINRGQALEKLERHAEASADFEAAIEIFEAAVPAGDRRIAWAFTIYGKHELAQKRVAPAIAALSKAVAILEGAKAPRPTELAAARFALARAKWDANDRKAALALAKAAREGADNKAIVDQWLAGKQ